MPPLAQEDDFIDLNDYDLDLTIEQRKILEKELKNVVDISSEIDLGMIKIILGELEEDDGDFGNITPLKNMAYSAVSLIKVFCITPVDSFHYFPDLNIKIFRHKNT